MATERQLRYINSLLARLGLSIADRNTWISTLLDNEVFNHPDEFTPSYLDQDRLSFIVASQFITELVEYERELKSGALEEIKVPNIDELQEMQARIDAERLRLSAAKAPSRVTCNSFAPVFSFYSFDFPNKSQVKVINDDDDIPF